MERNFSSYDSSLVNVAAVPSSRLGVVSFDAT